MSPKRIIFFLLFSLGFVIRCVASDRSTISSSPSSFSTTWSTTTSSIHITSTTSTTELTTSTSTEATTSASTESSSISTTELITSTTENEIAQTVAWLHEACNDDMECQSAVEFSVCSDGFCKCDESKNYFETSKAFADNRKISLRLENNDGEISTYCVSGCAATTRKLYFGVLWACLMLLLLEKNYFI